MSDDTDLEALFDEIAAQTLPAAAAVETATATATAAPTSSAPIPAEREQGQEEQSGKPMYERLGGIVRLLHDSMRELGYDRSLSDVASQIGDAQGRLEHVATLTEQAANKVLNTIDAVMPAQDALAGKARDIDARWERLFAGQMSIDEFKALASDTRKFSAVVIESTETEKARMLEIMMAQDFQDITGQLIKKIVTITSVAEHELAQLLRDNAPPELKAAMERPVELMNGPAAPGSAMGQTDVDDLLDGLGF